MAATSSALLLLALVALAGLVDLQAFAAAPRPAHAAEVSLAATTTGMAMADPELDGTIQCVIGCFTKVLSCAFKCLRVRKGIDLPLCVIGCNDRGIVCMFSCGRPPSPPGPKPPVPPAPPVPPTPPEPPAPKPKPPAPPAPKPKPPPAPQPKPTPPKPTPPYPPPAPTPNPPAPPTNTARLAPVETSTYGDNYHP